MASVPEKPQACTRREVVVMREELPLSCPGERFRLWDAHPRIYLPIEDTGYAICPYCDTYYRLQEMPLLNEQEAHG